MTAKGQHAFSIPHDVYGCNAAIVLVRISIYPPKVSSLYVYRPIIDRMGVRLDWRLGDLTYAVIFFRSGIIGVRGHKITLNSILLLQHSACSPLLCFRQRTTLPIEKQSPK